MAGEGSMGGRAEDHQAGRELDRRVERVEAAIGRLDNRFSSVADAARERQDDWGSVRAQADRVPELQEQMRELKQQLAEQGREIEQLRKLAERLESRRGDTAPAPRAEARLPEIAERAPERLSEWDLNRTSYRAVGRIPTEDEFRKIAQREVREALAGRSVADLIAEIRPDLGTKLQKLSPLLKRLGIDLDAGELVTTVIDAILDRIDLDQIISDVVSRLRNGGRRRRY